MLSVRLVATILLLASMLVPRAIAQDAGEPSPEFKAWWKKLTEGGSLGPNIDGISLEFDVEHRMPIPPEAEIKAMRAMVGDKPDHPLREYLQRIDQVSVHGFPVTKVTLWRIDNEWRINRSTANSANEYVDSGWANGVAWKVTDKQLFVDDQAGIETSRHRLDAAGTDLSTLVSRSLSCMLSHTAAQGIETRPRMSDERMWTLNAEMPLEDGGVRTVEASGTWDGQAGTIERSVVIDKDASGSEVSRSTIKATDWTPLPGSGLLIARVASHEVEDSEGSFTITSTLKGVRDFSRQEFESLVRVPSAQNPDAIRGPLTYTQVTDKRDSKEVLLARDASGQFSPMTLPQPGSLDRSRLRLLGWVLLAVLCMTFVFIRARASRG